MPDDTLRKDVQATVAKVDDELGLVIGFALVCKVDGEDYVDLQGEVVPEQVMLEAATDFMLNSRAAKDMHDGDRAGDVVFAFPLTGDVAKALEIETKKTGLLVALKPESDEILGKYRDGTYTHFSIGGLVLEAEDGQ